MTDSESKELEERNDAQVKEYLRKERMQRFNSFCPSEFKKKIDLSLVPNLPAWNEADKWEGAYPGIWLWSPTTGRCKTRMLWRKFGQMHVIKGMNALRITGVSLGEVYHDSNKSGKTDRFYQRMCECSLVFLDDLDKINLNNDGFESIPRMLREVFDRFYEGNKPVMVTSNQPISWFEKQVGPSCARRMREVCKEIQF